MRYAVAVIWATITFLSGPSLICNAQNVPTARATGDTLQIMGRKWRLNDAASAAIFTAGQKISIGHHGFEPQFLPVIPQALTARKVTVLIDSESSGALVSASMKGNMNARVKTDINAQLSRSGNGTISGTYDIYEVVDAFALVDALNSPENAASLSKLADFERGSRIITGTAIVSHNSLHRDTSHDYGVGITGTISNAGGSVGLNGHGNLNVDDSFSDGTVFAYQFSLLCWRKQGDKLIVGALALDLIGRRNLPCPRNTSVDPLEAR